MKLADLTLSTPFMNAACSVAKTHEDVAALCKTKAGAVLIGSITLEAREGNPEPRWFVGEGYALNSFGMPNGGLEFYKTELPKMAQAIHDAHKIAVLSIAGFSTKEYVQLAEMADGSGVDMLELNFGCPNVSIEGRQKPIVSFDPETLQEIIEAVQAVTNLPLAIKLSPYSNPADLQAVAMILTEVNIAAVVASNTFPNGFMANEQGGSVLANELAGVSGKALLAINLGQVKQFRAALPKSIQIIGVGGVETPEAAELYFQAGADVVQAATLIVRDGHAALDTLIKQNGE